MQHLVALLSRREAREATLRLLVALAKGYEQQEAITRAGALAPLIEMWLG